MRSKLLLCSCKKKSIEMLAKNGLCFPVFLLTALLFLSFLGVSFLSFSLLNAFLPWHTAGVYASMLSLFVAVFLLAPLWRGIQMLFLHEILFGRSESSLLFYCYSHKRRYLFAVRRSMRNLCSCFLCIFALSLLSLLGQSVGKHLLNAGRSAATLVILAFTAFFLLLVLFLFFSSRDDAFLWDAAFLSAPLLSLRQSYLISVRRMRSARAALRRLRYSFLPLWLLSILLLGIPLIVVFPYYLGTKTHLAAMLIKD